LQPIATIAATVFATTTNYNEFERKLDRKVCTMSKAKVLVMMLGLVLLTCVGVQAQEEEQHCIMQADRFNSSGELVERGNGQLECFDTIAEAVYAGSGGTILLPAETTGEQLSSEFLEQYQVTTQSEAVPLGQILLATYWENANKGGSSISIWEWTVCSLFYHWGFSTMPAGWDNRISSTESYAGCYFNELSEHEHHQGAKQNCGQTGCLVSVSPALDNQTSSTYLAP
jgi:hypothetical protein